MITLYCRACGTKSVHYNKDMPAPPDTGWICDSCWGDRVAIKEKEPPEPPMRFVRQIDLSKRDGCEHPDIKATWSYLVKVDGMWILGMFTREWYGWNFVWPVAAMCGYQIDNTSIQEVWEVEFP